MLRWRLVGAAALLVPLAILLWLDDQRHGGRPGIWISGFALLVAGLASGEINQFLRVALGSVSSLINTIAVIATIVCSMVPLIMPERAGVDTLGTLRWAMLGIGVGLAFVFGYELRRFPGPGESIRRLAGGTLSVAYLGFPIACLINLRLLQSPVVQNHPGRLGLLAVLSTLLVVKLSDTGAYLVGRTVGRTKLSRISPGKTWEGLMGGVLFGLLGAALTRWWILPTFGGVTNPGSIGSFALYAVTITGFGLAGDLTESVLKRDCQLKDSSHLLPGLGGILDVIDSVLAVAPVSLVWWASGYLV